MDFECFWACYPKRVAKKDARKAWDRLKPEQKDAAMKALPLHVEMWSDREAQFIPHAATWINAERWEDEIPAKGAAALAIVMRQLELEGR